MIRNLWRRLFGKPYMVRIVGNESGRFVDLTFARFRHRGDAERLANNLNVDRDPPLTHATVIERDPDTEPGPCYPNYPDLREAYAVHRRDPKTNTCKRCHLPWGDDPE